MILGSVKLGSVKLVAFGRVGGRISRCCLSKVVLFECCASFKFNESSSKTGLAEVVPVLYVSLCSFFEVLLKGQFSIDPFAHPFKQMLHGC